MGEVLSSPPTPSSEGLINPNEQSCLHSTKDGLATLDHKPTSDCKESKSDDSEGYLIHVPNYQEKVSTFIVEVEKNIRIFQVGLESNDDPKSKKYIQTQIDGKMNYKKQIEVLLKVVENRNNPPEDVLTAVNLFLRFFNNTIRPHQRDGTYFPHWKETQEETLIVAQFLIDQMNSKSYIQYCNDEGIWFKGAQNSLVTILEQPFF